MQLIVKWWEIKDGQNNKIFYKFQCFNTIECFSELIKIAQIYFSIMAHYANVERFFPWCSHKPKRKRNISNWTSFYYFKAGVQFKKTSFMQLV